jgi:hypothetical protein
MGKGMNNGIDKGVDITITLTCEQANNVRRINELIALKRPWQLEETTEWTRLKDTLAKTLMPRILVAVLDSDKREHDHDRPVQ